LFHISIIVIYPKNILAGHTTLHVKEIKTINMGCCWWRRRWFATLVLSWQIPYQILYGICIIHI